MSFNRNKKTGSQFSGFIIAAVIVGSLYFLFADKNVNHSVALEKSYSSVENNDQPNALENIEKDDEIQTIIDTLSKEVHESFYINKTINKGIVYIHAKMPNIIKEYLEYQFNKIKKF